jgi:hypothetical protein
MTPEMPRRSSATDTRIAAIVALVSFVAYLSVPGGVRLVVLVVLLTSSAGVVVCSVRAMRERSGSMAVLRVAAASAAGMAGSVLYLNSLSDEPTAIPIVGTLVLLMSLGGLFAASLMLRRSMLSR